MRSLTDDNNSEAFQNSLFWIKAAETEPVERNSHEPTALIQGNGNLVNTHG